MNSYLFTLSLSLALYIFGCNSPRVEKKTYVFKEIGWRIQVPTHFIIDSPAVNQNDTLIQDKIQQNSPDSITWKPSINFIQVKKDNRNILSGTIGRYTNKTRKDVEEDRYKLLLASMKTFESMPSITSVDTSSSTAMIGGLEFYRFYFRISYNNQSTMNTLYYNRSYKGYDVSIFFSYTESKIGSEFYEILNNSEFY